MKRSSFIILISVMLFACKKDATSGGKPVEIYLLKSFQLVTGKCQVNAATVVLEDQPLVLNSDITAYNKSEYEYSLTGAAFDKIKTLTPRTPFAITVNKNVVFYFIFMPSIMSSTCDNSITMDLKYQEKQIYLRLGYPWATGTIDDQRNNPAILESFKLQGKLR